MGRGLRLPKDLRGGFALKTFPCISIVRISIRWLTVPDKFRQSRILLEQLHHMAHLLIH